MRTRRKAPARQAPEITISNRQKSLRVSTARLRRLAELVASQEGLRIASLDVAIVDGGEIQDLNRRHLDLGGQTDVLSFDLSDFSRPGIAAQVVLCADVAARQGRIRGHGAQRELMLYLVHGLLHLMGYEDATIRGAARMHAREDEILHAFGVPPTYENRKGGSSALRASTQPTN